MKKFHVPVFGLAFLILISCAGKPAQTSQNVLPIVNPDASLAFFSENNFGEEMRLEYAFALQNAGLYNFTTETLSEEQVENAVEIRLNYKEEKGDGKIPILILEAEFLKAGKTWFRFSIKEESDKNAKKSEKKLRQKVLLERFLEETKRIKSEEPIGNNEA